MSGRYGYGIALVVAACSSNGPPGERGHGAPAAGGLRVIAEATCPGSDLAIVWRGVAVKSGLLPERGLRRVELRRADGTVTKWLDADEGADWPEVVFAPDCARVAMLLNRHGPIEVIATAQLARFAAGAATEIHYLDDQEPCALTFVYEGLAWESATVLRYRSGGEPMKARQADVTRAPTTRSPRPCRDPASPLYEPPAKP
jgi:hypothetical protein